MRIDPRSVFLGVDQEWLDKALTPTPHVRSVTGEWLLPVPESVVVTEQLHQGDKVWIVVMIEMLNHAAKRMDATGIVVASTTVTADAVPHTVQLHAEGIGRPAPYSTGMWRVELAPLVPCQPPLTEIDMIDYAIPVPALAVGEVKAL